MDSIDVDIQYIIKRDGVKQKFDSRRILSALDSAFQSADINDSDTLLSLTNQIIDQIYDLQNKSNKDPRNVRTFPDKIPGCSRHRLWTCS